MKIREYYKSKLTRLKATINGDNVRQYKYITEV